MLARLAQYIACSDLRSRLIICPILSPDKEDRRTRGRSGRLGLFAAVFQNSAAGRCLDLSAFTSVRVLNHLASQKPVETTGKMSSTLSPGFKQNSPRVSAFALNSLIAGISRSIFDGPLTGFNSGHRAEPIGLTWSHRRTPQVAIQAP